MDEENENRKVLVVESSGRWQGCQDGESQGRMRDKVGEEYSSQELIGIAARALVKHTKRLSVKGDQGNVDVQRCGRSAEDQVQNVSSHVCWRAVVKGQVERERGGKRIVVCLKGG